MARIPVQNFVLSVGKTLEIFVFVYFIHCVHCIIVISFYLQDVKLPLEILKPDCPHQVLD
jgi:hypothetical protein